LNNHNYFSVHSMRATAVFRVKRYTTTWGVMYAWGPTVRCPWK
jgi:hypothetical protein